ncbi:MAG: hypothetical protein WC755_01875 [Candidatus Woesearchaeota archaeon]|jgi:hypothetical protein
MAIEKMLETKKNEKKPILLFVYVILCATFAILLSYYLFPEYSSILFIAFCVIALVPVIVKTLESEDFITTLKRINLFEKKKEGVSFASFLEHSKKMIRVYSFVFLGLLVAFSFWYVVLPNNASDVIFGEQRQVISSFSDTSRMLSSKVLNDEFCDTNVLLQIQNIVTDCKVVNANYDGYFEYLIYENSTKPSKVYYTKTNTYGTYYSYLMGSVFWGNFIKLFLIVITSIIIGAGAIFALTFIASIFAVFVGEMINKLVFFVGHLFSSTSTYFVPLNVSLLFVLSHGLFMGLAYIFAAISGGLISFCTIRYKFKDKQFAVMLVQAVVLFLIAVGLLFLGAVTRSLA